ncbi:MlaD family protein [Tsukamurella serpentis]
MTQNWITPVPGMTTTGPLLVRRGLATLVALALAVAGFAVAGALWATADKSLTLVVRSIAPGVVPGTAVQMDGLRIGRVTAITDRGSGRLGVAMALNGTADELVTDSVAVAFTPGNTFGITVVALTPSSSGRALADGASFEPRSTPEDGTMSTLLRSLSSLEREGLRPHMSQLLAQADTTTRLFLPLIGAVGAVAEANADTQRVPTAQTLPTIAATLGALDRTTTKVLPGLQTLWEWKGPDVPGYPKAQTATIDRLVTTTLPVVASLLGAPNTTALTEVLIPVRELANRTVASMPDAARNGRQLEELIERVRRSMPDNGSGPVLNLDVTFQQFPAITSALPPLPELSVTPPGGR